MIDQRTGSHVLVDPNNTSSLSFSLLELNLQRCTALDLHLQRDQWDLRGFHRHGSQLGVPRPPHALPPHEGVWEGQFLGDQTG